MMLFLLVSVVALVTNGAAQGITCPEGYSTIQGRCLKYLGTPMPHHVAVEQCSNQDGGKLMETRSSADDQMLIGWLQSITEQDIWLSIKDPEFDGIYNYPDGSDLTSYDPWIIAPNSLLNQACASRRTTTGSTRWYQQNCAFSAKVVCEIVPDGDYFSTAIMTTNGLTYDVPTPPCGGAWTHNANDGICLRAIKNTRRNYAGASAYCKQMGGELAVNVFSYTQRKQLAKLMRFRAHFFIGLDDVDMDGTYTYKGGATMGANPPFRKKKTPGPGKCITMKRRRWFPKRCERRFFFICQKPQAV